MTENEMIKKHIEECEERIGRILGYMESSEDANTKFCERNVEVLKSVVIALERQMPKKVIPRHIRKYDGFDDGECPTCGNSVLRDGFSNDIYCDDCGQKLDWEGGE